MTPTLATIAPVLINTQRSTDVTLNISGIHDGNFINVLLTVPNYIGDGQPVRVRLNLDEATGLALSLNSAVSAVTAAKGST